MPSPETIGRYAVRRRIGSGGFATVWLGYDEQLDAPVAIKVLADNWTEQHEVRHRFVEEGRYLRRVESPHVVPVYDAGTLADGRPYLVMGYADQGTLADRLARGGVDVAHALEVVRQVGLGLQALHDRDVMHRDVKPANVLFRSVDPVLGVDGVRAMVGDLGLGKSLDISSRLTMVAGTPAYVAPEQAQGEAPDARADQYSLGVLTFLLLSGRLPFGHATLPQAAAPGEPLSLSTDERIVPPEVEAVVRRALAQDRSWRWPSVTAYVDALLAAAASWGEATRGGGTRVLPLDSALTQVGRRPSALASDAPLPDPVPPAEHSATHRRLARVARGLGVVVLLGAVGAVGAAAGIYGEGFGGEPDTSVDDTSGTITVTVPPDWDTAQALDGWEPPTATGTTAAAVSVGTNADWIDSGEGVFAGLLPATELPTRVPGHPECRQAGSPYGGADPASITVVYSGCPGGVVVERVVQVTSDRLLWIQVRADEQAIANRVLDGVETHGLS